MEEWRRTEWNDNIEVSNLGNVRVWISGQPLHPSLDDNGYRSISVEKNGRQKRTRIYNLVTAAFLGQKPPLCHVRHLNDIKTDDRLSNLSYGTPYQNRMDAHRNRLGRANR